MAGYYDAQGVWIHDEADTFPLTSEVLNRSPKSISDVLIPLLRIAPDARTAANSAADAADRAEAAALVTVPLVAPLDEGMAALIAGDTATRAGLSATYVPVIVYSGGAYPARPANATSAKYIGPVQPTSWLPNDEWVDNS